MDTESASRDIRKLKLALDIRLIVLALLAVIAAMLIIWKPWASGVSDRTVEVQGESTISATPDEFIFYPSYQFEQANKDTALAALTEKSDAVVAGLKDLGVPDSDINTSSSGYDYPVYTDDFRHATYTLQLTITVDNQGLAQKVQDYLLTTTPSGTVSPQPGFSATKQKTLEAEVRNLATKDARAKADQMAKNLGFRVGAVKSVSDSTDWGLTPLLARTTLAMDTEKFQSLTIQPGENKLPYSVTVVYYIR